MEALPERTERQQLSYLAVGELFDIVFLIMHNGRHCERRNEARQSYEQPENIILIPIIRLPRLLKEQPPNDECNHVNG